MICSSSFLTSFCFLSKWLEHKVSLTHIHRCHVLDYEPQIVSIILSHCHYSLRAGKGHDITYDFQSLQKHILDHYILGKPKIVVDIPHVAYRKDVHTATTFATIREKVKKQVSTQSMRTCSLLFCHVHEIIFSSGFFSFCTSHFAEMISSSHLIHTGCPAP